MGAVATPAAPSLAPHEPLPRSIEDFDKLIEENVTAFVTVSKNIGGLVEEQVRHLMSGRGTMLTSKLRRKQSSKHSKLNEHTSL
jgi:hypothetical protein